MTPIVRDCVTGYPGWLANLRARGCQRRLARDQRGWRRTGQRHVEQRGGDAGAMTGQSLVEFALTALLLLSVTLGGLQIGLAVYAGWIVLPGAVQEGATVAARRGASVTTQLEAGRRRTTELLNSSGLGHLTTFTVTATDLGETVEVRATGNLPLVLPLGSLSLRLHHAHSVSKEAFRALA